MKAGNRENFTRKPRASRVERDPARRAISAAKAQMFYEYSREAGEHVRLLRLALNEAEAVAWATGLPHLFFVELAAEKAAGVVRWAAQQRAVRRKTLEVAFAE